MTRSESAKAIVDCLSLTDDWDGLGAEAPTPETVQKAFELLLDLHNAGSPALRPPSRIAAGPDGCILFEWQEPGVYLEAEVTPSGNIEWMKLVDGEKAIHWVGNSSCVPQPSG